MTAPGFTHSYDFDPAYGMDLDQYLALQPPHAPEDFAAFWQDRYRRALDVDAELTVAPTGRQHGEHSVYDMSYRSTDGVTIGGWLMLPADGAVARGIVIGHGYGGCYLPDDPLAVDAAALLFPCFRGLGRSALPGLSQDPNVHVLHGIEDRHRYILGGCVEDLWLAVSALLGRFPQAADNLAYLGSSFGGGIGVLAAPWDARIKRLHVEVPTFGHQALRLSLRSVGSAESVRRFQERHDFNVTDTLAYYDAAVAAGYLHIPTLVAAALFDPAVPPPGQFAIYNAIAAPLRRLFVLDAGHFDYPERQAQRRALDEEVVRFLSEGA